MSSPVVRVHKDYPNIIKKAFLRETFPQPTIFINCIESNLLGLSLAQMLNISLLPSNNPEGAEFHGLCPWVNGVGDDMV